MKVINQNEIYNYMKSLEDLFTPNNEIAPNTDETNWESVDVINLYEQKPGTLIFLKGRAFGASYVIRRNENDIEIWRNIDANGFRAPLESIVSFEVSDDNIKIEEGVIKKRKRSVMPYFSYDSSKPKNESVLKPNETWMDVHLFINVQKTPTEQQKEPVDSKKPDLQKLFALFKKEFPE